METATLSAPPRAPAISAVCVDVRELLRRAGDTPPPGVYTTTTTTNSGTSHLEEPSTAAASWTRSGKPTRHTPFWAPGAASAGTYAVYSGPPPLSPADPTILHAILDSSHPSTRAEQRGGASAASHDSGGGGANRFPQSSRREAAPQGRTRRMVQLSTAAVAPVSSSSRSTAPPVAGRVGVGAVSQSFFMPPARTVHEADSPHLSPAAQQVLSSVLSRLQTHAASMLEDQQPGGVAAVAQGGRHKGSARHRPPPLPSLATKYTYVSPMQGSGSSGAAAAASVRRGRGGEDEAGAATPLSTEAAAHGLTPASTPAQSKLASVQERRQPFYVQERTAAGATAMGSAAAEEAAPLRRTVPPAFRRQLLYAEGAPTTRRPKRK